MFNSHDICYCTYLFVHMFSNVARCGEFMTASILKKTFVYEDIFVERKIHAFLLSSSV